METDKTTPTAEPQVATKQQGPLVRSVEGGASTDVKAPVKTMKIITIGVYVLLIALGVGTGYLLSGKKSVTLPGQQSGNIKTDTVVGSSDTKTFSDSAEGVIEKGGVDGEGTHKLVREGGPSQTAFLISSVVDLDEYVGKKVRVWGQTIAAQQAAWLMDVGKIELLTQ